MIRASADGSNDSLPLDRAATASGILSYRDFFCGAAEAVLTGAARRLSVFIA